MKPFLRSLIISFGFLFLSPEHSFSQNSEALEDTFTYFFQKGILDIWYPRTIDSKNGGFYSNFDYKWKIEKDQPKMLVSQSRHIWTCAEASHFLKDERYAQISFHGFKFIKNHMWDPKHGGFFNVRSQEGGYTDDSFKNEKRAYGMAFSIYGLSSLYKISKDADVLKTAKNTFLWLEKYSHDSINGGYVDVLDQDGSWVERRNNTDPYLKGKAGKDFNSSIHLLEAFTELYKIWPDSLVKNRLQEMFTLVRDTLTDPKGFLKLNFAEDWKHISLKDSSKQFVVKNRFIDHVSFGHDLETAFLLLEASLALGLENDTITLKTAKKLVDHSLEKGFDPTTGGFFYEGYYFKGEKDLEIVNKEKAWWVQAEGLNALLMMSKIYPEEKKYFTAFLRQWEQIEKYIIDKKHGEWYIMGLDYTPKGAKAPKASVWKVNYHNGRALMNCIRMLRNESELTEHFSKIALQTKK